MTKKEHAMAIVLALIGMAAYSFEWYLLWNIVVFLLIAWLIKILIFDFEE
jgi:hypothetical protein